MKRVRWTPLLLITSLCGCSGAQKSNEPARQAVAHPVPDGAPVPGSPAPEIVQLRKIEAVAGEKHITVGNASGDYVLVCNEAANDKKEHPIDSCNSPLPGLEYLLFRNNTKWLVNGATEPISLAFMQDYTVTYNQAENIGLVPAKATDAEHFGVYWLLSWTAKSPTG